MQKHYVNVGIVWFVLTFIGELLVLGYVFPPQLADSAEVIDEAFQLLVLLGMPIFTLVVAVMGYSLLKFRAKGDTLEAGETIHGNNTFSLIWLLITGTLCIIVIVHPGLTGLAALAADGEPDLVVQVVGSQWAWRVTYPQYGDKSIFRAANNSTEEAMLLPVDQQVRFEITSLDNDVLHSLWIPAFRIKLDAVPGTITSFDVTTLETDSYEENPMLRIQCAELCGLSHTDMMLPIKIVTQAEFDAWAGSGGPADAADTPAGRGKQLAEANACIACHSVDGSTGLPGPGWLGVYGSEEMLDDGTTVVVDENYIRESILDPNAKLVEGFLPNLMPQTFGDTFSEEQLNDLIAYIESLSE